MQNSKTVLEIKVGTTFEFKAYEAAFNANNADVYTFVVTDYNKLNIIIQPICNGVPCIKVRMRVKEFKAFIQSKNIVIKD
jgi:hypothetical protein